MKTFEEYLEGQHKDAIAVERAMHRKHCHLCRTREERKRVKRNRIYFGLLALFGAAIVILAFLVTFGL